MAYNELKDNFIDLRNLISEYNVNTNVGYFNQQVASDVITSDVAKNIEITAPAGENMLGGIVVGFRNGKCYKANNISSNFIVPSGILKTSVIEDEMATIIIAGIIDTSLDLEVSSSENPVYCRVGTLNLSQNLLTATSVDEDSICKIGVPINENQFILEIEKPIVILD